MASRGGHSHGGGTAYRRWLGVKQGFEDKLVAFPPGKDNQLHLHSNEQTPNKATSQILLSSDVDEVEESLSGLDFIDNEPTRTKSLAARKQLFGSTASQFHVKQSSSQHAARQDTTRTQKTIRPSELDGYDYEAILQEDRAFYGKRMPPFVNKVDANLLSSFTALRADESGKETSQEIEVLQLSWLLGHSYWITTIEEQVYIVQKFEGGGIGVGAYLKAWLGHSRGFGQKVLAFPKSARSRNLGKQNRVSVDLNQRLKL